MNRKCSDCQVPLEPIRIVDATEPAPAWGGSPKGATHTDLAYAPIDATATWFTRTVEGTVPITAMMCTKCSRIHLYGT